jgi:hypothetical protein
VRTPDECPPICGAVGHHHVNVMLFKCEHDGRIGGWIDTYETHTGEPVLLSRETFETGPFTADLELPQFIGRIRAALEQLL